jgi:hypothetical protein
MLIIPVAVEKVGFPEKSQKSADRKCLAWIIHDFASKKRKGALKD